MAKHNTVKEGILDWYVWYAEHRNDGRSLEQDVAFMKRAMDGLFDLLGVTAVEIEHLKEASRQSKDSIVRDIVEHQHKIIVPVVG